VEQLRRFGIEWSIHPSEDEVRKEYDGLRQRVGERPIETLADLPRMKDSDLLALMEILLAINPPAAITDRQLFDLAMLRMANLSLEHGHCDGSPLAFAELSQSTRFGHHRDGFRFGHLGVALAATSSWKNLQYVRVGANSPRVPRGPNTAHRCLAPFITLAEWGCQVSTRSLLRVQVPTSRG